MKRFQIGLGFKLVVLVLAMLTLFSVVYWNIDNWSQSKQKENWNSTVVMNYQHILNSVLSEKNKAVESTLSSIIYSPEVTSFIAGDTSPETMMVLSGFYLTFSGAVHSEGFFILDTLCSPLFQETGTNKFTIEKSQSLEKLCKKSAETFGYEGSFITVGATPKYFVVTPIADINDNIKGYVAVTIKLDEITNTFAHTLQSKAAIRNQEKQLLDCTDSSINEYITTSKRNLSNGSIAHIDTISYRVFSLPLDKEMEIGTLCLFTDATKEIQENTRIHKTQMYASLVTIIIVIALIIGIINIQLAPLRYITSLILEIQTTGNLKKRAVQRSHDEIGTLTVTFNRFLDTLAVIISKLSVSSQEIGVLLEKIVGFASHLNNQNKHVSEHTGRVANSASSITKELQEVTIESQHNADGIATIASVVNELSSSVNSVADNCRSEAEIANEASIKVTDIHEMVMHLDNKLTAISTATNTIAMIAKKTTLLSINASVEASRAGEAGKGFAVVANEVKKMAAETTKVSESITNQVHEIQGQSKNTVADVAVLTKILQQIKDISSDIHTAVDEQNVGLHEVASATETASGFVVKLTGIIGEISSEISVASDLMTEVNSNMVLCNADSDVLVSQIETFKDEYRHLEAIVERFQV